MRPRTCLPSAFALSIAVFIGTSAIAAELPKEGSFKGFYSASGTLKPVPLGKERVFLVYDENGLSVTDGFLDRMTWHCWGLGEYGNGMGQEHGYCVMTDPDRDQIGMSWGTEKHAAGQKDLTTKSTLIGGTGKFAGISGTITVVHHGNEFRTAVDGTFVTYDTIEGNYKLP